MKGPLLVALVVAAGAAQAQVVLGQIDDFQDGTRQGWTGGASPTNIATGGPAGSGDRYLRITSTGGGGQGSRLATYNDVQWAGNFLTAGVNRIEADFNNFGSTTVELRLVMFILGSPNARFTSATPLVLAPGSGWQHGSFAIDAVSLVRVAGTATYAQMLANVSRTMFRHDPGTPSAGGASIVGQLGIDNVRAVPEPLTFAVLGLGFAGVARRRRRA